MPCLILTQHLLNIVRELVQLESSHRCVPVVRPTRTTRCRSRTTSLSRSPRGDCGSFGGGLCGSRDGGPLTNKSYKVLLIPSSGGRGRAGLHMPQVWWERSYTRLTKTTTVVVVARSLAVQGSNDTEPSDHLKSPKLWMRAVHRYQRLDTFVHL